MQLGNALNSLTEVLESVLDDPTWFSLIFAFQATTGNLSALAATVQESQAAYKGGEMLTGSFLDNHDQPRFQSLTQDDAVSPSEFSGWLSVAYSD